MMEQITLGRTGIATSRLAYGCWRIAESGDDVADLKTGRLAVMAALEAGYTLFDLADIYCGGRSEIIFGKLLKETPHLRRGIVIATKCGIRQSDGTNAYRYDLSAEYIIESCEGSLRRLGVDAIDLFQLHRPDWLMHAAEVAEAFDRLLRAGKVRTFGVSNFGPSQVELLQHACGHPLAVNQVELSLLQLQPFGNGVLDQCQRLQITPMAWSPLGGGLLGDGAHRLLPSQERYEAARIVGALDRLALQRGMNRTAVALAWLLAHPSGIVPIVGSTQPERIQQAAMAGEVRFTRGEWYGVLELALGERLP